MSRIILKTNNKTNDKENRHKDYQKPETVTITIIMSFIS